MARADKEGGDALDVLEREDRRLRLLFERLDSTKGASVEDRWEHGVLSKQLIRSVALREAAKADVADAVRATPGGDGLRDRVLGDPAGRRRAMVDVDDLLRGVAPMDLNKGQDFDDATRSLRSVVEPEVEWELGGGIDDLRAALTPDVRARRLHSARHLRKHAPSHVDPAHPHRYERTGPIGRFLTVWYYLRDRPRPVRGSREQVEVHVPGS